MSIAGFQLHSVTFIEGRSNLAAFRVSETSGAALLDNTPGAITPIEAMEAAADA